MAKIEGSDFDAIASMARDYMANGSNWSDGEPKQCDMVESGALAWELAHRAGITSYCYGDTSRDMPGIPGCVDAHIKTALARIFPNAVFRDKYVY